MIENALLQCLISFNQLLHTKYSIHLGRAGKTISFDLDFTKHDCYHLMGLHYLEDRRDNRGRNYIYDELLISEKARHNIATSEFINNNVINRISLTSNLEILLDDNNIIFRYNPKRLRFYTMIESEFLLENSFDQHNVYVFLDKRPESESRFCRSIYYKTNRDYSVGQTKWTLLYKKKFKPDGTSEILYHNEHYIIPPV